MWSSELATALRKNLWLSAALVFLFVVSGFFGIREFWRWYGLNSEFNNTNLDIQATAGKTDELKGEIENMNNPDFVEKEARAKLNLKKEGESVLVVVSENNFPQEDFLAQLARGEFDQQTGVWLNIKSWRRYFFP